MTADKGQTPIRLAAGEDEAVYELWVYNYLVVRDEACGYSMPNEEDAFDEWKESAREIVLGIDYARNRKSPTIATLTAQLAAAEAKVEAAYRAGVTAACKEIAPAADMEDHELTQYGRDKRTVADYAYRTLLSPALLASAIRALANQHKPSPDHIPDAGTMVAPSPAEEPMP